MKIVKRVFSIPEWYEMSDFEMKKLISIIKEASTFQEAQWYRFLDCSAFCVEEKCFFCGEFSRQQTRGRH